MTNIVLQKEQVNLYRAYLLIQEKERAYYVSLMVPDKINYIRTNLAAAFMIQNIFSVIRNLKVSKVDLLALFWSDTLPFLRN